MWQLAQEFAPVAIPYGSASLIVVASLGLLWRFGLRMLREQERAFVNQNRRLTTAEDHAKTCEWQLSVLQRELRRHGIEMPDEFWGDPPWAG